jgi:hypothetical protein
MRGIGGLTDLRSAGTAALAPGSIHSHIPGIGERGLIRTAGDAERFVTERFAEGSDFLKILIDLPGASPDQATVDALVAAAHGLGLLVVAHALSYEAAEVAQAAGVDALTHTPLDRPLDRTLADRMAAAGRMLIPTLVMMEALTAPSTPPQMLAEWAMPGASFDSARERRSRVPRRRTSPGRHRHQPGCRGTGELHVRRQPAPRTGTARRRRLRDVDQRVEDMDRNGIGIDILSLGQPGIQGLTDARTAVDMAQKMNDEAAGKLVARHPERLRAFAAIPLQEPEQAAEEMRRTVREAWAGWASKIGTRCDDAKRTD